MWPAAPRAAQWRPVPRSIVLPSGLRLVLTFADGNGFDGTLTRDVAFGPQTP